MNLTKPHKIPHPFHIGDLIKLNLIALKSRTINHNFTEHDIQLDRSGEPLACWLDPYQVEPEPPDELASRTCQNLTSKPILSGRVKIHDWMVMLRNAEDVPKTGEMLRNAKVPPRVECPQF